MVLYSKTLLCCCFLRFLLARIIAASIAPRSWLLAMVAKVAGRWLAGVNTRPDVARHCSSTHDICCESRAARRAP